MKRLICLFMALSIMIMLSLCSFASSANDPYYNDYGYLTFQTSNFNSSNNYSESLGFNPSLILGSDTEIPAGFVQVAYAIYSGPLYNDITAIYGSPSGDYSLSIGSSQTYFASSVSGGLYGIQNRCDANGNLTFRSSSSQTRFGGGYYRISCFVPVTVNGTVIRPEAQVQFTMNTAVIGYNLSVNSQINSGDSSSVDYYIFPSTTPISSGSTSTIVPFTPASELTETQQENFLLRGFKLLTYGLDDLIIDIASPKVSLSTSSSVRSSSLFDPTSYGVSFEKIGVGRLYPSSGGGGITPTATLSLKDMISSHTGVYASSTLKLVAVVNTTNTSFVATFDFAPAAIVGGSPVPPTTLQGQVPYPDFDKPNSDFKDLADYLKQLMQAQNDNAARNNSNFIANLMAIPWANFVGTGFGSQLPNLSMYLDSLFDSLFDKYTAPSEEQINLLVNEVNEERAYLREKLAFVADVKSEVFFIQSTFISAGDSPRPFKVTLPDFMMGYTTSEHQEALVRYDLIDNTTRQAMHDVIIVFCTLAVVMHIWHTLPSTVGNMPRD